MSNSQVHVDRNYALDVAEKAIAAWDRGYEARKKKLVSDYESELDKWNVRHWAFRFLLFFLAPEDPRGGGFGSAWDLAWWKGRQLCSDAWDIKRAAGAKSGAVAHITVDSATWAKLTDLAGMR